MKLVARLFLSGLFLAAKTVLGGDIELGVDVVRETLFMYHELELNAVPTSPSLTDSIITC